MLFVGMTLDWCVNSMSQSVYRSDHMVQGNFSSILTHGPSLPLPLASPPLTSPLSFMFQRGDQQEGVDLTYRGERKEREEKKREKTRRDVRGKAEASWKTNKASAQVCVCV